MYYITRKPSFPPTSRSLIVMTHLGSQRRRRATLTERAGSPLRQNGAHSLRVTPVDMAAGRLDILGKTHKVHEDCLLFHVLKQNVNMLAEALFLLFTSNFKHFYVAVPQIDTH